MEIFLESTQEFENKELVFPISSRKSEEDERDKWASGGIRRFS
jgi:hypothetical protein